MIANRKFVNIVKKIINPIGIDIVRYNPALKLAATEKRRSKSVAPTQIVLAGGDRYYGNDWHNIEYVTQGFASKYKTLEQNIDIAHDLTSTTPLPIEGNSVSAIYTSHVIEHLKDKHVEFMFADAYRVLRSGGVFRISCPDAKLYLRAFLEKDINFFHYRDHEHYVKLGINNSVAGLFLDVFATSLGESDIPFSWEDISCKIAELGFEAALDHYCNQVEYDYKKSHYHVNWFTIEKLTTLLQKAGFGNIYCSALGQSYYSNLRDLTMFDMGDPKISLFIECSK